MRIGNIEIIIRSVKPSIKSQIKQIYKEHGYIPAIREYRTLSNKGLKKSIDTVKPWCIKWGYNPNTFSDY